jgi:hypothetical protein
MLRILISLALALFASMTTAKDLSLDEIRQALLDKEVVILGATFYYHDLGPTANSLRDWKLVEGDETTGYKFFWDAYASANLRGKRGRVISINLEPRKVGEIDAFGKPIDASRVINPYIQVIVRADDDARLMGTTGHFGYMIGRSIQLASRMDALKSEIEKHLARLIGKPLYKTGHTKLLDAGMSLQDLLEPNKRKLARDYETKNLTPMKVVDAKLLEAENAVVIKVELPNGASRLLFGELEYYDSASGPASTVLDRMQISAVEKIPSKFSPKELAAIKEGKIFRGMSEDALYCSWGYADKINDWGRGGAQHIYAGSQYVYVDGKVVRDWQSVE